VIISPLPPFLPSIPLSVCLSDLIPFLDLGETVLFIYAANSQFALPAHFCILHLHWALKIDVHLCIAFLLFLLRHFHQLISLGFI
jgi:hypothetical protein